MAKTKITPHALNMDKTQKFIDEVQQAIETFEDQIGSMASEICEKAYKNFVTS